MANENEQVQSTVLSRPDGTQYTEETFSLAKTNEIQARFRGDHQLRYHLPVAVAGNIEATLANLRAFVSPEADFATVLVDKFTGQGLRLDVQKRGKDLLGKQAKDDTTLEGVQQEMLAFRLGQPRPKSERKAREGKVAAAEARTAQVANTALEMFRKLTPRQQKEFAPGLVATGAVTQEQVDEILAAHSA